MRVFLLSCVTMLAFASNSLLNRAALSAPDIAPILFGTIRFCAGAVMLALLVIVLRRGLTMGGPGRIGGVISLFVYMYGFSWAYLQLDAGLGALILFGMVQVTMFGGALLGGERPPVLRWVGAGFALAGLAWLLLPGAGAAVSLPHAVSMAVAGIAWGVYSLEGRKASDPLVATAANFILAAPLGLMAGAALPAAEVAVVTTPWGITLAIVAGAVTSGMGYALWYSVLPRLAGSVAAVAQLTVPVIAMVGGVLFLGEAVTLQLVLATGLVLGGVGVSLLR